MPRSRLPHTLAWLALVAAGAAGAAAADGPRVTEARNAAAGFAIVSWMTHVDTMGRHCSTLPGEAGAGSTEALVAWQEVNAVYVDAALAYVLRIADGIAAADGGAARQRFDADRKREFADAARSAQAASFPDGTVTVAGCRKLASALASGDLDLQRHGEFFPLLRELAAEARASSPPR